MSLKILSAVLAMSLGLAGAAQAKGCIKGALVGGVAGHMVHHGFMGAAAGCVTGRHLAHEKAKQEQIQRQQPQPAPQQPVAPAPSY